MSGNGLPPMESAWCFVLLISTLGSCNAFPKPAALLCVELTLCRAAESDSAILKCYFLVIVLLPVLFGPGIHL